MQTFTLAGNRVEAGLRVGQYGSLTLEGGKLLAHNRGHTLLAVLLGEEGSDYRLVNVGKDPDGTIVIASATAEGEPDPNRCLVLVHEYSPGSGAKRWPSFHIDWDHAGEVTVLARGYRSLGSGSDDYSLVLAPMGWPENIAGQFVNKRDYGGQVIAYRPDFNPREKELERELDRVQDALDRFDQDLEAARRGQDDQLILSFLQGKHPKTGDVQWEATVRSGNLTMKYVVNRWGQQPQSAGEEWACRKSKILVDRPTFQLVLVDLLFRPNEREGLVAKIAEIEAELAQIRGVPAQEDNPTSGDNTAMAEALRKAGLAK